MGTYSPYRRRQPENIHGPKIYRFWRNKGRWNVTVRRGSVAYTIICNAATKLKAEVYADELIGALKGEKQ